MELLILKYNLIERVVTVGTIVWGHLSGGQILALDLIHIKLGIEEIFISNDQ